MAYPEGVESRGRRENGKKQIVLAVAFARGSTGGTDGIVWAAVTNSERILNLNLRMPEAKMATDRLSCQP